MSIENGYLTGMLKSYAAEINETLTEYYATIDNSGAILQLKIRKK